VNARPEPPAPRFRARRYQPGPGDGGRRGAAFGIGSVHVHGVPAGQAEEFIAAWEKNAEAFAAAAMSAGFQQAAAGLAGYRPHPDLYRIVRT
jgi:hypothetical protein